LLELAQTVGGTQVIVAETPGATPNVMRQWIDQVRKKSTTPVAVLLASSTGDDKVMLVADEEYDDIDRYENDSHERETVYVTTHNSTVVNSDDGDYNESESHFNYLSIKPETHMNQPFGEIEDEHDEADAALWIMEKPGVYLAHARAPLEEIEAAIGLRLRTDEDDEEIDTLGGLVFLRTGRVPARGEIVPHESGVAFEVIDADPRRIKRLRLRLPGAQAAPAALPPPAKD
jgi:hypothetical protein